MSDVQIIAGTLKVTADGWNALRRVYKLPCLQSGPFDAEKMGGIFLDCAKAEARGIIPAEGMCANCKELSEIVASIEDQ